jgi:hypothetical protein
LEVWNLEGKWHVIRLVCSSCHPFNHYTCFQHSRILNNSVNSLTYHPIPVHSWDVSYRGASLEWNNGHVTCTVAQSNCRPWQCSEMLNKTILITLYCNSCWNLSPPALFHTHMTNYATRIEIHTSLLWCTVIADSVHIVQHTCTFLSNSKTCNRTICSYKLSKTRLLSLFHFFHWKVFSQKNNRQKAAGKRKHFL